MIAHSRVSIAPFEDDFSRLFTTTAMAFEREAMRITKHVQMSLPKASGKRSNGR